MKVHLFDLLSNSGLPIFSSMQQRTEDKPRSKRDLRVDIPASMPLNVATPPSASTPQVRL